MEWLSYIYKARDKLDKEWEKQGQIFSASRPRRDKAVASINPSHPILICDIPIRIRTSDNLLDTMIGKMQHVYDLFRQGTEAAPA